MRSETNIIGSIFIAITLMMQSITANAFNDLSEGVTRDSGTGSFPKNVIRFALGFSGYTVSYINAGENIYYTLSGSDRSTIKSWEVINGDYSMDNGWPLTRWPHEYIAPQLTERLQQEGAYDPDPTPEITLSEPGVVVNGCLSNTPLRYGDIDGNTNNEVVVFADQDIVVFSPQKEQFIFQVRWSEERYGGYFDEFGEPIEEDPERDQGLPQFKDSKTKGPLYPGLRAYAKMYVGEFDGNEVPDILVWHKLYESNKVGEAEGFSLIDEKLIHYELITTETDGITPTGEYLPLETSSAQVEQWLEDNELTWQAGFPNKSECPGQTDRHILEMVDPLLNDPDVLK